MSGSFMAVSGALVVAGAGARWFWLAERVRLPKDATAYLVANVLGALLGVAAFVVGAGGAGRIAAAVAILGGLGFLALFAASGQAKVTPAVSVGGTVVDFVATDDEGRPFALESLRGRPFLLKFFRGHW